MVDLAVPIRKFIGHAKPVEARLYEIHYEKTNGNLKSGYLLVTEDGTDYIFFPDLTRLDDDEEEGFKDRRR